MADAIEQQIRLVIAGFSPGKLDGVVGPRTRRAIQRFQGAVGAQETGTLTEAEWDQLLTMDWAGPERQEWTGHLLPQSHLRAQGERTRNGKRANPLRDNERLEWWLTPEDERSVALARHLAVEQSVRYLARVGSEGKLKTYCNVYATDFVNLANRETPGTGLLGGLFLPRVWWSPSALRKLKNDPEAQVPDPAEAAKEQSANCVHEWLRVFGGSFGWERTWDVDRAQQAANQGKIVVASGRRAACGKKPSGHVTLILPEFEHYRADRDPATNRVRGPVQSEASEGNHETFVVTGRSQWWEKPAVLSYLFAIHD